jgi:hypothetical protein
MEKGPGFSALLWNFLDGKPKVNHFRRTARCRPKRPLSRQMSKELASRGFKFVGPTIVYAFMQAVGMVNDHLVKCHCHRENGKSRPGGSSRRERIPIKCGMRSSFLCLAHVHFGKPDTHFSGTCAYRASTHTSPTSASSEPTAPASRGSAVDHVEGARGA